MSSETTTDLERTNYDEISSVDYAACFEQISSRTDQITEDCSNDPLFGTYATEDKIRHIAAKVSERLPTNYVFGTNLGMQIKAMQKVEEMGYSKYPIDCKTLLYHFVDGARKLIPDLEGEIFMAGDTNHIKYFIPNRNNLDMTYWVVDYDYQDDNRQSDSLLISYVHEVKVLPSIHFRLPYNLSNSNGLDPLVLNARLVDEISVFRHMERKYSRGKQRNNDFINLLHVCSNITNNNPAVTNAEIMKEVVTYAPVGSSIGGMF